MPESRLPVCVHTGTGVLNVRRRSRRTPAAVAVFGGSFLSTTVIVANSVSIDELPGGNGSTGRWLHSWTPELFISTHSSPEAPGGSNKGEEEEEEEEEQRKGSTTHYEEEERRELFWLFHILHFDFVYRR